MKSQIYNLRLNMARVIYTFKAFILTIFLAAALSSPAFALVNNNLATLAERAAPEITATQAIKDRLAYGAQLYNSGQTKEADNVFTGIMNDYDKMMARKDVSYGSFADLEEYEYFVNNEHPSKKVVWVDRTLADAIRYDSYCAYAEGDIDGLIDLTDTAASFAPYDAAIWDFFGYCDTQLGTFNDAVKDYGRALWLANQFQSESYCKITALNGRGYAYVHLGQYDNARADFNSVLAIEPNNQYALTELNYIDH